MSGLHTEGVTDFGYFLYGCKSLKELDLTGISTADATSGYGMFSGMSYLGAVRIGAAFSWVGDAYLPLPPAAGADEVVEPEKGQAAGEGEGTGAEGAQKSMKEEAR